MHEEGYGLDRLQRRKGSRRALLSQHSLYPNPGNYLEGVCYGKSRANTQHRSRLRPIGDVLYIIFGKPREADDSEITEEVVIRLKEGKIVGLTILNASKRMPQKS